MGTVVSGKAKVVATIDTAARTPHAGKQQVTVMGGGWWCGSWCSRLAQYSVRLSAGKLRLSMVAAGTLAPLLTAVVYQGSKQTRGYMWQNVLSTVVNELRKKNVPGYGSWLYSHWTGLLGLCLELFFSTAHVVCACEMSPRTG